MPAERDVDRLHLPNTKTAMIYIDQYRDRDILHIDLVSYDELADKQA